MAQLFNNFARSNLTGSITNVATSLGVTPAHADRFPIGTTTNWFKITVIDLSGNYEIMRVDVRGAGVSTLSSITRAQDGTAAQAFAAGSLVLHGPTAADVGNALSGILATLAVTGAGSIGGNLTVATGVTVTAGGLAVTAGNVTVGNGSLSVAGAAFTPPVAVTFSATPAFDASKSNVFRLGLLTANVTAPTIINPSDGQTIQIRVKQDGTGGRSFAAPANAKVSGAIETTLSRASLLTLTYCLADAVWEGGWTTVAP